MKQGATGTDGVTFGLTTQIDNAPVTVFSQHKTYTGALTTVTADLSAYEGQTLQLFLTADAGASYTNDWGAWTDFRLVADSVPPPPSNGCTINGAPIANGVVNPAVSCQICDPNVSTTAWSTKADSCLIGGQCYAADALDTLGCKRCDPLVSQTSWSNMSACANLIVATTTNPATGEVDPIVRTTEGGS